MSWIAVGVSAAAGIGGSLINANASRSAANTQADAARDAQGLQLHMYEQGREDLAPWLKTGQQGLNSLMGFLGVGPNGFDPNAPGVRPFGMQDFQQDPGYQFRLNEGLDAVLNKRSALGGVMSGNTLRDLTQYGQGFASNEFQNAYNRYNTNVGNVYNRLGGLANTGINAAGQTAGLGANAAARSGEFGTQAGNALAAGAIGQGNAWNDAIGGVTNTWLQANARQNGGGLRNQPGWSGRTNIPLYGSDY